MALYALLHKLAHREMPGLIPELLLQGIYMVAVHMGVPEHVDEVTGTEVTDMCYHSCQQRI